MDAENFTGCKELLHLSEERETPGRFGDCGKTTFCHSLPETTRFFGYDGHDTLSGVRVSNEPVRRNQIVEDKCVRGG